MPSAIPTQKGKMDNRKCDAKLNQRAAKILHSANRAESNYLNFLYSVTVSVNSILVQEVYCLSSDKFGIFGTHSGCWHLQRINMLCLWLISLMTFEDKH